MKIDVGLTQKLAHLSRLRLTEAELTLFTGQLEKIIEYVGQLQAVDVKGVEPLLYPSLTGPGADSGLNLRPDTARAVDADAHPEPYRVPQVV